MGKKKKWTKKKKIIVFILAILIVIIAFNALKPKEVEEEKIETEAVQKRNIAQSVSATGVISTENTKSVTAPLTGMQVKTVDVKEGQKVAVGDVICTFDTSDVQYNLAVTQDTKNLSAAQANIGTQSAQRSLNDAVKDRNELANDVDVLQKTMDGANINLKNAQTNLQTQSPALTAEVKELTIELENLNLEKKNIEDEINSTPVAGQNVSGVDNSVVQNGSPTADLENKLEGIKADISAKSDALAKKQAELDSLQDAVTDWSKKYNNAVTSYNTAKEALEQTDSKQIPNLQDSVATSQISASMSNNQTKTTIKSMQDQIQDGIVKSTVSGTVTKVNVKTGDMYAGTEIALIEGCEDFIVEAEIDEYDIPDIEVGMKVLIKTDATREEELEGKIIYTAPSATQSASSLAGMTATATTGGTATYKVKIALDTPNDRLRLGMNAKLSIITDSRENVWSVPFEAVYEREDGTHYIEILKDEKTEEKQELTVEKGLEGTYYVEIISNELNENMQVVLPKIEAGNSLEDLIEMMGAEAGL